jgi:hypothetical protein
MRLLIKNSLIRDAAREPESNWPSSANPRHPGMRHPGMMGASTNGGLWTSPWHTSSARKIRRCCADRLNPPLHCRLLLCCGERPVGANCGQAAEFDLCQRAGRISVVLDFILSGRPIMTSPSKALPVGCCRAMLCWHVPTLCHWTTRGGVDCGYFLEVGYEVGANPATPAPAARMSTHFAGQKPLKGATT